MKKIILSNCTMKNGNRGCVALSISTMYILKEILDERGIEYQFYLPQSGFKYQESGKHSFMSSDLYLEYYVIPNISSQSKRDFLEYLLRPKYYFEAKKVYKYSNYILDIGQGDSFSDIYGIKRFETIYSQYKLGMKYKVSYCILPQTIGPFRDQNVVKKARKGLQNARCIMVRDKKSQDYVKELCIKNEAFECIDVAFFMPFKQKKFNSSKVHIGLNVSGLLWNGGYTQDNQFGLKLDYRQLIKEILNYFMQLDDIVIHLIPHVVDHERSIENDYAVCCDIVNKYDSGNVVLAPLFFDPIEAKSYISGMDFFLGARMHATIAAFSSGVPVCPMAYSRKFNGLFADTLTYPYMIDMTKQNMEEALREIKKCYVNRKELKRDIKNRMNTTVKERYHLMKELLTEFLDL